MFISSAGHFRWVCGFVCDTWWQMRAVGNSCAYNVREQRFAIVGLLGGLYPFAFVQAVEHQVASTCKLISTAIKFVPLIKICWLCDALER